MNNALIDSMVEQASKESVILKTGEGHEFILAEIDDFVCEVDLLKNSTEFMEFLDERSKKRATIPLTEMRSELHKDFHVRNTEKFP